MDTTCISYHPAVGCKSLIKADCENCKFKKTRAEQLAMQRCAKRLKRLGIKYEPLIKE